MANRRRSMRGELFLRLASPRPQALLNAIAQEGLCISSVRFYGAQEFSFVAALTDAQDILRCAEALDCRVLEQRSYGMPVFVRRMLRRYGLMAGLLLFAVILTVSSLTVITISVEGNEQVPQTLILSYLHDSGVKPGTFTPTIHESSIALYLINHIPELSWCAVNIQGTHVEVLVRERIETPEQVQTEVYGDLVAQVPGLILDIDEIYGKAQVEKGDIVVQGDVLISGSYEQLFPQYSELEGSEYHQVHATGTILARTWRRISLSIPLSYEEKHYTGEEKSMFSLLFGNIRVNFFENSGISYASCDKIISTYGASWLPVSLVRECYREYTTETHTIHRQNAEELLKSQSYEVLLATIGEQAEVSAYSYDVQEENGLLIVTIEAECREEIGVFVPYEE